MLQLLKCVALPPCLLKLQRRRRANEQLLFKKLTLKGSTLRSRDAKYQQNLLEKFAELALPLLKEKKMKIEVHEVSIPESALK